MEYINIKTSILLVINYVGNCEIYKDFISTSYSTTFKKKTIRFNLIVKKTLTVFLLMTNMNKVLEHQLNGIPITTNPPKSNKNKN